MPTKIDNLFSSRCSVCIPLISPPASCAKASLRLSSDKPRCTTCALFWTAISEKLDLEKPTIERVDSIGGHGLFSLVAGPAKPRFTTGSLWDHVSVTLALDGEAYCPSALDWLPVLRKSPLSRTKERDIKLVRDRIENCRENHPNCPNFDDEELPTRVINVGLGGRDPFLHISQGARGRYLALSHRWGDPNSSHKKLLTLKGNLAAHCKRMPLSDFPKTFRDAIEVARGLGVQYVWIDSICIVQDDTADWEVEAGRMHSVYSGAFATIFADRATHSNDGLFRNEKDRETSRPVRIIDYKDGDSGRSTRILVQTQIDSDAANFATDVTELFCQAGQSESQLAGRGWILQEECLSRRRIQFTETELIWKCPTISNCDCGLPVPPDMADPGINFAILEDPKKGENQPWKTPTWLWQQLVEHYTSRSLTYETDRLIALAGIATKAHKPHQDYFAGMWRDQLNASILWKAAGAPSRCYRTTKYVAPSWSWASVSGKIRFIPLSKDTRFIWEVIDAKSYSASQSGDFGKVSSAYLKARSKVVHVKLEERQQNMRKQIAQERWDSGDATWKIRGDEVRYMTVMPAQPSPDVPPPLPTVLELDVQSDWDVLTFSNQPDFRLLCIALVDTFWEGYAAERALCLLLKHSPKEQGSWERVCYVFLKGTWKSWEPYVVDEEIKIL
ncbi:HET-domain-containing protein [Hypoxylon sp. EC38]|nr:HET-domain-containing protein [Hypoxylon sp. EC38]